MDVTLEQLIHCRSWWLKVDGKAKYIIDKEQPLENGMTILVFLISKVGDPLFDRVVIYSGFVKEGAAWWERMQNDPSLLLMELNL